MKLWLSPVAWILILSIITGQLIKLPIGPSGTGLSLLDLVVVLLAAFGLLKLKFRLKRPPLFLKGALVFTAVAVFSLIFTPLHLSLMQYLISFSYTLRFFLYLLLAWVVCSEAFPKFKENLNQTFFLSGLSLSILGLLQLVFLPDLRFLAAEGWDPHYFRTASTFLDPNFLGTFLSLTLLSLLVIFLKKSAVGSKPLITVFIIIYVALLTTFSRSSYLVFGVSFLLTSILKRSIKLLLLTTVLSAGLLIGFKIYTIVVSTPRHIDRTQSATFRLSSWQDGIMMFQKSPILGVGFNNYRYGLEQYNLADKNFIQSHGASTNDSSLLYVLSTTGVLGFLAYLFPLASLIYSGWKKVSTAEGIILISATAALIASSFFNNTLFYPPILIWLLLIGSLS